MLGEELFGIMAPVYWSHKWH